MLNQADKHVFKWAGDLANLPFIRAGVGGGAFCWMHAVWGPGDPRYTGGLMESFQTLKLQKHVGSHLGHCGQAEMPPACGHCWRSIRFRSHLPPRHTPNMCTHTCIHTHTHKLPPPLFHFSVDTRKRTHVHTPTQPIPSSSPNRLFRVLWEWGGALGPAMLNSPENNKDCRTKCGPCVREERERQWEGGKGGSLLPVSQPANQPAPRAPEQRCHLQLGGRLGGGGARHEPLASGF